jgi:hypothetical protein
MRGVVVTVASVVALAVAHVARADVPPAYQYAGTVAPIAGIPSHVIVQGDGFLFAFRSYWGTDSYRVCLYRQGNARPFRCFTRRASNDGQRYKDAFRIGSIYPAAFGALVAKWHVDGMTVASWRFWYESEGV